MIPLQVLLSSIKVQDERLQVLEQGLASLKLEADRNSSGPLPDLSLSSPADGPLDEAAQGAQMTEDVQLLLTQTEELLVCAGTPLRGEDGMQQEEQQQQPQPQLKQEPAAGASSSAPALAASPPQLQPPPGGEVITKAQCIHLYEAFVREVASLLTAVQERKPEALAKVHELTQALDEQLRRCVTQPALRVTMLLPPLCFRSCPCCPMLFCVVQLCNGPGWAGLCFGCGCACQTVPRVLTQCVRCCTAAHVPTACLWLWLFCWKVQEGS